MAKIIIEIQGGLISAVYTDSNDPIEVEVIDRDCSEEDAEYYDPDYAEDMKRISDEIEHNTALRPIW